MFPYITMQLKYLEGMLERKIRISSKEKQIFSLGGRAIAINKKFIQKSKESDKKDAEIKLKKRVI